MYMLAGRTSKHTMHEALLDRRWLHGGTAEMAEHACAAIPCQQIKRLHRRDKHQAEAHPLHDLELPVPRPGLLGGRAEQLEDGVQLLDLALPREQHLLGQQLGHDAAQAPHVDRRAVLLCACAQQPQLLSTKRPFFSFLFVKFAFSICVNYLQLVSSMR